MPEAEGDPVQLFVYDLSGGMARTFSQMLLGRTIEAVYHTSIVVAGSEFYFGGGINVARAGHTPFGRPIQVLDLGHTQLPEDVREALLADLSERYTPESYSLFSNNCNNFSDELAQLLCGCGIPEHITGLPAEVLSTPFGQMIAPMLSGLEQQMRGMRAQAYRPHIEAAAAAAQTAAPTAAPAPSPSVPAAALAAAPASSPTAAAEAEAPAVQAAVPGAGEVGGAAAAEEEGAGLRSAEVEIEAAVAAGMIQEAEQALGSLELQPAAAAAAAAAAGQPAAVAGEPTAAGAVPPAAPTEAAASTKLATELAVDAEFKRLVGAGMAEHEAQALALEAVAAAAGAATDNPVQHGQGADGTM